MRSWLDRIPLKLLALVVAVSLYVQEWFPLSHFPMYANPSKSTYFIYLTDEADTVLPVRTEFGIFAAAFKKVHRRHLQKARTKNIWQRASCKRTLDYALEYRTHRVKHPKAVQRVKLWAAKVSLEDGKLNVEHRACAERNVDAS